MPRRDFQDILTDLEEGQFHADLTTSFPELIRKVQEANLVGTLTITLKVKPRGRQVDIIPSFTAKAPTRKTDPSVFFVDDEGTVTRSDPKQLPLRMAAKPPTKLRVAGSPGAQGVGAADDSDDDKQGGQN